MVLFDCWPFVKLDLVLARTLIGEAMRFNGLLASLLALTVSASCWAGDGMSNDCPERHSKAWCVLDASNISAGTKDVSRDSLKAAGENPDKKFTQDALSEFIITQGGHLLKQDYGVATFGAGNVLTLVELAAGMFAPTSALARGEFVVGWVPASLAKSPEEAAEFIDKTMMEFVEHDLFQGATYEVTALPSKESPAGTPSGPKKLTFQGGVCEKMSCEVVIVRASKAGPLKAIPDYVGSTEKEGYLLNYGTMLPRVLVGGKDVTHKVALALSKKLPATTFLTVTREMQRAGGYVSNVGNKVPFMANQGKALVTVFPELST